MRGKFGSGRATSTRQHRPYAFDASTRRLHWLAHRSPFRWVTANPSCLFDEAPAGIVILEPSGRIVYANAAAGRLFGVAVDWLVGLSINVFIPKLMSALRPQRGGLSPVEFRPLSGEFDRPLCRRADGTQVPIAILAASCREKTRAERVICMFQPDTERQVTDRDLQRFFELSPDLLCIADLQGYFRKVNPNFAALLGYSEKELTQQPFLAYVHPEDHLATLSAMERLSTGGSVTGFRNRYRDFHGNYHWLEWTATSAPEDQLVFAVARDVTAHVQMQQQLIAQERRERAILDNTSAVIYVKDCEGRYQFINREFSRLFNVSLSEAVTKTDADIFPGDVAAEFQRNDRRVLETESELKIEEVAPHADGLHTYVSVKFPVFNGEGRITALAGISTDITDRIRLKQTADELRLARHVQRRLFPTGDFQVPGFDVFGKVFPASELCGDYFDYVVRPSGNIAFCVGDVSGHGMGPALQMVETRAILRMLLRETKSVDEVVGALNGLLWQDIPESSFLTLFLTELDPVARTFRYVGAGHDAVHFDADGVPTRLPSTAPVLGLYDVCEFPASESCTLQPGEILLICTDGVHETMSPSRELFGQDRVLETVASKRHLPAADVLNDLFATAHAFSRRPTPKDDMTGVLIKAL